MQRRLEVLFPIVMLALLVQLLVPIGALRAVAQVASDPLYMAEICSGMTSSEDGRTPLLPSHDNCCSICAIGLGGSPALNPPAPFVAWQRDYRTVAWRERIGPTVSARTGSSAQARAPPAFS